MSLSVGRDFEPDVIDLLSYAPFAASYSLSQQCQKSLRMSYWHGLWIVPLNFCVNVVATGWLLVASLINGLAATALGLWAPTYGSRRMTSAYDTLLLASVTALRSFHPLYLTQGS